MAEEEWACTFLAHILPKKRIFFGKTLELNFLLLKTQTYDHVVLYFITTSKKTSVSNAALVRMHALAMNSTPPPSASFSSHTGQPLFCDTDAVPHLKDFPLLLNTLGKHARDKDEDEAVAGEDDQLQPSRGSELVGQGEQLV